MARGYFFGFPSRTGAILEKEKPCVGKENGEERAEVAGCLGEDVSNVFFLTFIR